MLNNQEDPHSVQSILSFPDYEKAIEAYEDGENDTAIKLLNKLLELDEFPDKHVCWYLKGQIALEENNFQEAWTSFLKAKDLGHVDSKNLVDRVLDLKVDDLDEEEVNLRKVAIKDE